MAQSGNASLSDENLENISRRKSPPIRVNYLRCLSTNSCVTLSRQSSLICSQSLRRSSGLVSVQPGTPSFRQEIDEGECFLCSHRELPAVLDDSSVQPFEVGDGEEDGEQEEEQEEEEEEEEGTMKIPFQSHPALNPSTSSDPDLELECCICFNRRDTIQMTHKSCILMPCQHHQLCLDCANQVDMCPLCREQIQSRIPVESNAASESPRKCLMRQFSIDSTEELPGRRRCRTVVTVLLCMILAPAVFVAFHYAWTSWNIVKILIGAFLSSLVVCLVAIIADRCIWRKRRMRSGTEIQIHVHV